MLNKGEIIEIMDEETWLTASECEEYGFCDVVEEEKQIAASIDKEILDRYRNIPKTLIPAEDTEPEDTKEQKLLKQKMLIELEL